MIRGMLQDIIYVLLFLTLLLETVIDIYEKKIWLPLLFGVFPMVMGLNYYIGKGNAQLWLASLGVGLVFFVISILTRGQIGKGDALLFALIGAGLGLWNNLLLLYMTFLLAFCGAMILVIFKKANRKKEMPLTPFLLLSYVIWLIKEIWK